jgi:phenylalanyl-tRNA synthetase beta chain
MKCSLNWLNKFIDLSKYSHQEISDMLTTIGLEVEGFEEVYSLPGGLEGVVIGEVLECEKHPDADKLSLTKVTIGTSDVLQIVCGAPNVAKGQKVLVATNGTKIFPKNGEPFTIKKAKIRGAESNGMLCAADELGLNDDHSGIIVLPQETVIGTPASKYYEIAKDVIFEIGLTPNRSDATCHAGVARDLFAYIKINKDNQATFNDPVSLGFNIDNNGYEIKVEVANHDLVPRYAGVTISGITVGESPAWLKNQLLVLGLKPINNIVDVTNYILHELGQPLHAFDADEIDGRSIKVKTLPKGTKFKALDSKEYELNGEEIMICNNADQGLCIAGVYGGLDSGVSQKTTTIFLESAHFNASSIRKASMKHNLRTDAAKVFEKGSDPNVCLLALKRAASMILKVAGGTISSEIVDIYPNRIKPKEIHIKYENIKNLLGITIDESAIHEIINALGMEIHPVDDFGVQVYVPTNKAEVLREVDVIEEILRIYGFNQVPISTQIKSTISYSPNPNKYLLVNGIASLLTANGFNEIMGLSLIESKLCKDVLSINDEQLVYINNTSNVGLDVMRPSMLLSGLLSVVHNTNRQQNSLKLYEFGKSYLKNGEDFMEREELSVFITGLVKQNDWQTPKGKEADFYSIKQVSEQLIAHLKLNDLSTTEYMGKEYSYGLTISKNGNALINLGEISSSILKKVGVKQAVFHLSLDVKNLMATVATKNQYVKEISKFPAVKRDLALVLKNDVSYQQIEQAISKAKPKFLKNMGLFDIYKNDEVLGKDNKSYALNFVFENLEKTLVDADIEADMNKILHVCKGELGAVVRQ